MFALTALLALSVTPGIPPEAKKQYAEAGAKLSAGDYPHANDMLNVLAAAYPRWPEIFASRCSAQLGLKHWDAAAADCSYALQLKPKLPAAVYGLAVAEDGRGHYADAVHHYRAYAALDDPQATLKTQAQQRADVLAPRAGEAPAPPMVTAASATTNPPPPPPPTPAPAATPAPKGNFQPGIPSSGRMLLYVFRNLLFGLNTPVSVAVDGQSAGELPNDSYLELDLAPGKHAVTLKAAVSRPGAKEPTASWELSSQEGDVSYVKLEYAPQGDDVGFKPVPVKGAVGRKEIREDCGLISSRRL